MVQAIHRNVKGVARTGGHAWRQHAIHAIAGRLLRAARRRGLLARRRAKDLEEADMHRQCDIDSLCQF